MIGQKGWTTRLLLAGTIVVLIIAWISWKSQLPAGAAAPNSSTVYLVNGEEMLLNLEPVVRSGNTLLPDDVFRQLGVRVLGPEKGRVTLSRKNFSVVLTLGSRAATVKDEQVTMTSPPHRQGGYLYLPADALPYLGFAYGIDGDIVEIHDLFREPLPESTLSSAEFIELRSSHSASVTLYHGRYGVGSQITHLTPKLVSSPEWNPDPVARAQALQLLQTYTVLEVKIINQGDQFFEFVPEDFALVDAQGRQYDPTFESIEIGNPLPLIVPGAHKRFLVLFPRLPSDAASFGVFHKGNSTRTGNFPL